MDEFDTAVREAKQPIEPRKDFVETTMQKVNTISPRRKFGKRIWIPSAVGGAALIVVAILLLPLLQGTAKQNTQSSQPKSVQTQQAQQAQQAQSATGSSATIPALVNDASLQSDLNGVNTSMNQESSDQNNADSSLNDSSQQVTVPSS